MPATDISMAHYRVRPGLDDEFLALLEHHERVLRDLELVSDRPVEVYVGEERGLEGSLVVEIFEWASAEAVGRAHTHPRISETWESMEKLCEERGGRPMFEFPHLRQVR